MPWWCCGLLFCSLVHGLCGGWVSPCFLLQLITQKPQQPKNPRNEYHHRFCESNQKNKTIKKMIKRSKNYKFWGFSIWRSVNFWPGRSDDKQNNQEKGYIYIYTPIQYICVCVYIYLVICQLPKERNSGGSRSVVSTLLVS